VVQNQPGQIVLKTLSQNKNTTKKGWWSGLRCIGPEFKPQYCFGKNVRPRRTRLKPRWLEERKIYYTSGPAPWISPKNGNGPAAQGYRVFMPQNAEASKQEEHKQTWQLAFHWEVTT
jgi:hypothetical protein